MCRGVSHTPFMAGNMHLFDEMSYYSAANYALFTNIRAYAIRPYTCSFEIKRISLKHDLENLPSYHPWATINPSFAAVRAYAIRPYTCSFKTKQIHNENIISFPHVRADAVATYRYSISFK